MDVVAVVGASLAGLRAMDAMEELPRPTVS
jgi:hypothetical protein